MYAVFSLLALMLIGCNAGPTADQIDATVRARLTEIAPAPVTIIPLPTRVPPPTATPEIRIVQVEVTRVVTKIVTQTPTPTPLFTSTPTPEPAQATATARAMSAAATSTSKAESAATTATAVAALNAALYSDKEDGFYLVNVDIGPGLWRSLGSGDRCYWERLNSNNDILDNHFGLAGGTVRIFASDFQFHTEDCGTWQSIGK